MATGLLGCALALASVLAPAGPTRAETTGILTGLALPVYPDVELDGRPVAFPRTNSLLTDFETLVSRKPVSIVEWWQPWYAAHDGCSGERFALKFDVERAERVRRHGAIPMVNWGPRNVCASAGGTGIDDPLTLRLEEIAAGKHDAFLIEWARGAASWGKPFFLVFGPEMNGDWHDWGTGAQPAGCGAAARCNTPADFVAAWRHARQVFKENGAGNAIWTWNIDPSEKYLDRLADFYPGDSFVDWTGFSIYNWGPGMAWGSRWTWAMQLFPIGYRAVYAVAPSKPLVLTEFGSSEVGGDRAEWLRDTFTTMLPKRFQNIKGFVWSQFDARASGSTGEPVDWRILPNTAAARAFASAMDLPVYRSGGFGDLAGLPPTSPNVAPPVVLSIETSGKTGNPDGSLSPLTSVGGKATIIGTGFGNYRGDGAVTLVQPNLIVENVATEATILDWSDTRITIEIPDGTRTGTSQVVVWGPGGPSGPDTSHGSQPRLDIAPRYSTAPGRAAPALTLLPLPAR